MEINGKIIGSLIAQQIMSNLANTFTIEYSDSQVEIIYNGGHYKNKVLFTTYCGENRMYEYAFSTKRNDWVEISDTKCNRFIDNMVFWAGYVCGELTKCNYLD